MTGPRVPTRGLSGFYWLCWSSLPYKAAATGNSSLLFHPKTKRTLHARRNRRYGRTSNPCNVLRQLGWGYITLFLLGLGAVFVVLRDAMDFWPEFLESSWGREFVAGGIGGIAGIISGYPLDTLRVRQQSSGLGSGSAVSMLRKIIRDEGPVALYRGMGAPLASVTFQNAMVFQIYANLSRAIDASDSVERSPPSYKGVALGGTGTGAIQSFILTPVELLKVQLQLQNTSNSPDRHQQHRCRGPISVARMIFHREGIRGMYRGLTITMIRDAPSHGVYFWTYEYMREWLHPNCRANGDENLRTMLVAGGSAGVASWIFCYPLDVVKTRLQAQSELSGIKYKGIVDCFRKSVRDDGYGVLWRGLGTAVARAFVVNGAIFSAYETALRWFFNSNGDSDNQSGNST